MPRHRIRSLWALISMNGFLPLRRQPLYLINTLTSPFSFLFFFYIIAPHSLLPYAVAGGMILTVLSIGTSLQADLTHYKQDLKLQEMVVASPVSAGVYVTGMALSEFVYSIPGMAVFVLLSLSFHSYLLLGGLGVFVGLVLLWIFASALGFTLATYLQDVRETFVISPLVSIALSVIPPVYYPIAFLPAWIRPLAYAIPTTWAANLIQGSIGAPGASLSLSQAFLDVAVLLLAAAILFLVAWKKAQWRET